MTSPSSSLELAQADLALLSSFGFDEKTFRTLQGELAQGRFPTTRNQVHERIEVPHPEDLNELPSPGSALSKEDEARGQAALARGEVAAVVLNGGMATRFGGVVKGVVEVVDGLSFLGLRLRDVARAPGRVPAFLMNSFATDADTRAHLRANDNFGLDPAQVHLVTQGISLRLTPAGEIFRTKDGKPSFYAPGHGDLFHTLAASPAFADFVAHGGKLVLVSNVDNVGATLSPRVIGAHLRSQKKVTVEVAPREKGDKGGAPARVRDHVEVLEGFRFPPDFDIARIPVFNTNTMLLATEATRADYPLTWFRADKTVGDKPVVQFERLMGEVTAFVESNYLVVPRTGPEGRFLPVKTPEDLTALRPVIRERLWDILKT